MLLRFKAMQETTPLTRYRVVDGDSLQKISGRFYSNADHWKKIYDHNKLTSTVLVSGSVLEIPKV
jgi:nucleoid-associated protein YgaU